MKTPHLIVLDLRAQPPVVVATGDPETDPATLRETFPDAFYAVFVVIDGD